MELSHESVPVGEETTREDLSVAPHSRTPALPHSSVSSRTSHLAPRTRSRFAPSPTGELHLGNARTALLAWLHVRSVGGEFIIRVEDLDRGRVRPGILEAQLADLRWLGLDWDEGPDVGGRFGPYLQSQRRADYEDALNRLSRAGRLYECVCTRREIAEAASAPHDNGDEGPRYPGTCDPRTPATESLHGRSDRNAHALRFRVLPGAVTFHDILQGDQTFEPYEEVGDFVVRRKDGVAAYQLAVVVDDAAMEITHVVRGADLLSSTARQVLLYEALDLTPPVWLHVPLLLDDRGERMAKRYGAITLAELRASGVNPGRVVGWLAESCGLAAPGENLQPADLVTRFSLDLLPRESTLLSSPPFGDDLSGDYQA
ncbi:MAG TPA: tRNA glutamyl-Q(34) synthetase GluQRS [Longimicrobiaceae bacterium]|nr:tRNA glutamyl-Q(34) synthetase GluQRS [Longimicrobiaceae bacterium]